MEFRTIVDVPKVPFQIEPREEMLFVGSCFADSIGHRFQDEQFRATVNPYGTMYNPASVLHTIERYEGKPRIVFITLGTNHVYRLKETGEIVDNCQKRPAALFQEEQLTVDECADYLCRAICLLRSRRPDVHVVLTVSPIRYRKYGYHESQLSKATLLLAADMICHGQPRTTRTVPLPDEVSPIPCPSVSRISPCPSVSRTSPCPSVSRVSPCPSVPCVSPCPSVACASPCPSVACARTCPSVACARPCPSVAYFPAYEIVMDELRDYRFYADDMLHPSSQAVEYIWERLVDSCFSPRAKEFLREWAPLKAALAHRPCNPDSPEYRQFIAETRAKIDALLNRYQ